MNVEIDQQSFRIEGPDKNGHVWACAPEGCDVWCEDLGPVEFVAEMMPEWFVPNDQDATS